MSAAATADAKGEKQQVVELVEDDDEFEEFETGLKNNEKKRSIGLFFFSQRESRRTTEWAEKDEDKEDKQAWQDDCMKETSKHQICLFKKRWLLL